jgi:hypothetical protein
MVHITYLLFKRKYLLKLLVMSCGIFDNFFHNVNISSFLTTTDFLKPPSPYNIAFVETSVSTDIVSLNAVSIRTKYDVTLADKYVFGR